MSQNIINIPKDEVTIIYKNFWEALIEICKTNNILAETLDDAYFNRNKNIPTTVINFRKLLPRPFTYLILKDEPDLDIDKLSVNQWKKWIEKIYNSQNNLLAELLQTRSVAVFHSLRYLPLIFLKEILNFKSNRCADLGCSINYGFTWLTQINRNDLKDISNLSGKDFKLTPFQIPDYEIGIDYQPCDKYWVKACYFPKHIKSGEKMLNRLEKIYTKQNNHFIQANLTKNIFVNPVLNKLKGTMDLVHASLIVYMLNEKGRYALESTALKLLHEDGLFIQTDMFDPNGKLNNARSVKTIFRYKHQGCFSPPMEILEYASSESSNEGPSDSCRVWYPGKDITKL